MASLTFNPPPVSGDRLAGSIEGMGELTATIGERA
jgi:hypothetical protein